MLMSLYLLISLTAYVEQMNEIVQISFESRPVLLIVLVMMKAFLARFCVDRIQDTRIEILFKSSWCQVVVYD